MAILTALVVCPTATLAGTYDVPACDAANGTNNSWAPFVSTPTVAAYALCPSGGDPDRGMVARTAHVDATSTPGVVARLMFSAPPATAIVGVRASYDFSRADQHWEAALSNGSQALRGCGAGGLDGCASSAVDDWISVPPSGVIYIDVFCAWESCPQSADGSIGAKARLYSAVVRVQDDQLPSIASPAGNLWTDGWHGGTQNVSFDASDNTGIHDTSVLIDGQSAGKAANWCDYTFPTPCPNGGAAFDVNTRSVSDGRHQLQLQATDAAGNTSTLTRDVLIDNTPPGPPAHLAVDGGDGWHAQNDFAVQWTNLDGDGDGGAPVAGVAWQVCPDSGNRPCQTGSQDKANITSASGITVPAAGDWTLRLWLRDGVGNADIRTAGPPVHLRYDDDAPIATFAAFDAANPTHVAVSASDRTSGVAAGSIEIKRHTATAWTPLATQVEAAGLVAMLPDEDLRDGLYDLRATAVDQAGNERSTTVRPNGTPAQLMLPVRSPTHLKAGRPSRARSAKAPMRTRLNVRYRARVRLRGRLTDSHHKAMRHVPLTVMARTALRGAQWRTVKTIHTTRTGRFSFWTQRGPSHTVRVRYEGTPTVRASHASATLRVAGSSSIHASPHRLRNGRSTRFSGTVRGRVRVGKLVQLQTKVHNRWQTFTTTHVRAHGRWSRRYRFIGTHGRADYVFRALLPQERGYPYRSGHSSSIHVLVRGP